MFRIIINTLRNQSIKIILFFFITQNSFAIKSAHSLVVGEGFSNPIGFYDSQPTFSWKLPTDKNGYFQSAYQILVSSNPLLLTDNADLWNSGKVSSAQSISIKYLGKKLESRQKIYWQIKFWNQSGVASNWSNIAHAELGLLNNSDWEAQWISFPFGNKLDTTKYGTKIYEPQYLRKDFQLNLNIVKARLYITSKGVFEAQINGTKVGEAIMPPGFTPYRKRIESLTYDVTTLLKKGDNAIGIILAPGWYSGRIGWSKRQYVFKESPKAICQLEVFYDNGTSIKILSDKTWKATNKGPIRFSEIYDGEVYNGTMELLHWSKFGYSDSDWKSVITEKVDSIPLLTPKRHNAVQEKIKLQTKSITRSKSGTYIFDLGQNMVGVPRVKVPMLKDDTLTIRFAEMLQQNGELYTENYRNAASTDYYIAGKNGFIEYVPKFTFHGFRYVEIKGFDSNKTPDKSWVTGLVQYSDFEQTGKFQTSDKKLNQLQSNIEWGLRGNFFDIPTDCPQRDERMGWTGDAQVFAPTSYYIVDVQSFWSSWLQSVREEQLENGIIPIVVPNVAGDRVSPGWGDVITIVPWESYLRTGNKKVLEENYEAMKKWIAYYQSKAKNNIINIEGFGDWLQPFSTIGSKGDTSQDLIGTAYYAYSVNLTLQSAKVLGYDSDIKGLDSLYSSIRNAFEKHFFDNNGKIYDKETQTGYLLAIGFDLLSEDLVNKAKRYLVNQITIADNHLRTGFLGTPLLAPVLDKLGENELAYKILFQETYPSWLYPINQGATTMWERWNSYSKEDGFGNAGMNSFNHYAYGAIGQWMYERIAGIYPLEPGYKKIRIAPYVGTLSSTKGEFNSPYGKIISQWTLNKNKFELNVSIPPNSLALVQIPTKDLETVSVNGKSIYANKRMKIINKSPNYVEVEVVSGDYNFKSQYK